MTLRHIIVIKTQCCNRSVTEQTSDGHLPAAVPPPGQGPSAHYAGVMPDSTVAVVLAAGAGTRFVDSRHKLLVRLPAGPDGPSETVSMRAVRHAVDAAIGPVVVVTGAVPLELPAGGTECRNPAWADGQATSLQVALDAARRLGATSMVVGLADQPGVSPDAWRSVAAADAPIAVATYDGRRGNPVGLDSEVWHLLPTEGDEGARRIMRVRADLVREVPCTGSAADIDTVEDLARWQKS